MLINYMGNVHRKRPDTQTSVPSCVDPDIQVQTQEKTVFALFIYFGF